MELSEMRGVGPARMESLRAVGITSLRDLLYTLPVRYEDRTQIVPCKEARGEVLVMGVVPDSPKYSRFNGLVRVTASFHDDTGRLPLAWYNQPWMMQQLPVGEPIMLFGRVAEKNGRRVLQNASIVDEKSIQPVYRAIKGIPAKSFRTMMEQALSQVDDTCPETLPNTLRLRHGLCELNFALREAHFPANFENLKMARRRLAFEQMLMYQAALGLMRHHKEDGMPIPLSDTATADFWATMPFPPTGAQKRVLEEVASDLRKTRAMSRLIQGDVGCGKTALAFGAIAMTCTAGFQAAMMAPTEILARQHYESAKAMLEPLGLRCGLLIGSMKAKEKRAAHAACVSGEWDAVFGTHALISEGVKYKKLGLVVTDEQHRFGVRQRSTLQEKGAANDKAPHVLVMSATPIPRTLALILYGDLDVSVVDELPPGRTPVKTRVVPESKRDAMYGFLREEVAKGRQGYVVCPLVDESEMLEDVRSARETYDDLVHGVLYGLRVGLTWGTQKADDKAAVLADFASGALDVLVSTTVIEVGVNVPNASVMIIENAERYGLSQLHQLRGRVGRGSAESWCFLLAEENERLRILSQTNDGFLVAQKDLELRGPGDLMGTRQSGEMLQGFLLDGDVKLLEETANCMKQLRADASMAAERAAVEAVALRFYGEKLRQVALN
ncbi:MAG: ATP-dependent DNA helicase RecG [Clostridiales bacterium]|nr:ATP-dependent DNA helicase RecG [Clostridiales bacterium]